MCIFINTFRKITFHIVTEEALSCSLCALIIQNDLDYYLKRCDVLQAEQKHRLMYLQITGFIHSFIPQQSWVCDENWLPLSPSTHTYSTHQPPHMKKKKEGFLLFSHTSERFWFTGAWLLAFVPADNHPCWIRNIFTTGSFPLNWKLLISTPHSSLALNHFHKVSRLWGSSTWGDLWQRCFDLLWPDPADACRWMGTSRHQMGQALTEVRW